MTGPAIPWLVVRMQRLQRVGPGGLRLHHDGGGGGLDPVARGPLVFNHPGIYDLRKPGADRACFCNRPASRRPAQFQAAVAITSPRPRLNDLGNLFLSLTILWAYMAFAQLLIIWMGNTSPESPWYVRRGFSGDPNAHHGWKAVAALLILGHFFVPFFILLGRTNKRRLEPLSMLAILMIIMRVVDCFWFCGPTSLDDRGKTLTELTPRAVHWIDLAMPPALFFIWLAVMLLILKARPLLRAHRTQRL